MGREGCWMRKIGGGKMKDAEEESEMKMEDSRGKIEVSEGEMLKA